MNSNAEVLRGEMLDRLRIDVESGSGEALLEAISLAATLHLPMPTWLAGATTSAIASYRNWNARTLDEAFGVQRPKGQRQDAVLSENANALYVIAEVFRLRAQGEPIDAGTFEKAGRTCGVEKTTAEKWFYKHKKDHTDTYLVAMQMAGFNEE